MPKSILITGGSGLLAINWAMAIRDRFNVILGCHNKVFNLKIEDQAVTQNFNTKDNFY